MDPEDPKTISLNTLAEGIKAMYNDEDYADLTIRSGSQTFKVHKAIVCARSDFFKVACKKSAFKEGEEGIINLATEEEDDTIGTETGIVRLMIEYLYTSDYRVTTTFHGEGENKSTTVDNRTLTTHAKVFAAAEKFQIQGLKLLAAQRFDSFWGSESGCNDSDIAEAIRCVYTTTAREVRELRRVVEDQLKYQMDGLSGRKQLRKAVESIEGLAYKLFLDTRKELKDILVHRSSDGNYGRQSSERAKSDSDQDSDF